MAYQQGALAAGEKEIILQIINLDRRHAGDVMKARAQMACISDDLSVPEMIEAARRFKHRRLPDLRRIGGHHCRRPQHARLAAGPGRRTLALAIEFPSFVPESMNLLQLLKSLQRQQRGLAIVLDEFGGTAGIVTIEDILAEVLGEIHSEHATERAVLEKLAPNRWRVSGGLRLDNFRREYPQLPEVPGCETMAGLALRQFEVVPAPGESVAVGRLAPDRAGGRRTAHSRIAGRGGQETMSDSDILILLAALLCVALSFLFSGMETGVLALNRFRVRQRMRSGDRPAAVLHGFLQNPEDFLWTILVGNTVVNFVIFSLGVMQLRHWLGHRPRGGGGRLHRRRLYILHRVRTGAQDTLPTLSQPPLAGPGRALPPHPPAARPAGRGGRLVLPRLARLDRRHALTRAASSAAATNCALSCRRPPPT